MKNTFYLVSFIGITTMILLTAYTNFEFTGTAVLKVIGGIFVTALVAQKVINNV